MWIFAGGMFRSGSTLQYQMLSALIESAKLGHRVEWRMPETFRVIADDGDETDELLVFKTHECRTPMRDRLLDGRAIAVSVHRDLRDVAVSGARKAGVTPDAGYCRELAMGCMACANGWPDAPTYREWAYDDLTANPERVLLEMSQHIRVPCDQATAADIAARFTPDAQRERIADAERQGLMQPCLPGYKIRHVTGELLHPNHLQDGRTGVWRDVLDEEAVTVIETIAGDWLTARGYRLSSDLQPDLQSDLQQDPVASPPMVTTKGAEVKGTIA